MADVKVVEVYLIYDVRREEFRVRRNRPSGRFGEFAYRVRLAVPKSWGRVLGDIDLVIPEPPLDLEPIVTELPATVVPTGSGGQPEDSVLEGAPGSVSSSFHSQSGMTE